jgi:virulence factor Mce-like protein
MLKDLLRYRVSAVRLGAILVGIFLVLMAAAYAVNRSFSLTFWDRGYELKADFVDADGIANASDVRIAGSYVGQITEIRSVSGGLAEITFRLDKDHAPMHEGTRVNLRLQTLLGTKFLEVAPGPGGGSELKSGTLIPADKTQSPVDFDQILQSFDQPTRDGLAKIVKELGVATDGRGQDINGLLGELHTLSVDSTPDLEVFSNRSGHLDKIMTNFNDVAGNLATERDHLAGVQTHLNTVLATIAQNDASFRRFIDQGNVSLGHGLAQFDGEQQNINDFFRLLKRLHADLGDIHRRPVRLGRSVQPQPQQPRLRRRPRVRRLLPAAAVDPRQLPTRGSGDQRVQQWGHRGLGPAGTQRADPARRPGWSTPAGAVPDRALQPPRTASAARRAGGSGGALGPAPTDHPQRSAARAHHRREPGRHPELVVELMAGRHRSQPVVNPAVIGLIAAGAMLGLLFFAFTSVALFTNNIDVKAQVASGDTLAPGADVEVAGVKIGRVNSIEKGDPGALVDMNVDARRVAMFRDASLQIRPHGVFGPKFVEIDPGTEAAGAFQSGSTVGIGNTRVSVDFEQVLNELNADTRTSLRTVFYELGTGSENRGADFGTTIDQINVVEQHLTPALQVIDSRQFELGRFIDSSAVINETLAASPLDQIIKENADVLAKLDAKRGDVTALVVHGNNVLSDLDIITSGDNVAALRSTIAGLPNLADKLTHFSNGLGFATNSLAAVSIPKNGQTDSDIGLAIRRTLDAFGECDITDQGGSDTLHATSVKIVPCYSGPSTDPMHPYGTPYSEGGHFAHHHVKVLFGLHTDHPVGSLEEEKRTVCGPSSKNHTRQFALDGTATSPAFMCFEDPVQSIPITPLGSAPPSEFAASSSLGVAPMLAPNPVTLLDLLLGK